MAQVANILSAKISLEDRVSKKMQELQEQLNLAPQKDTVSKIAEEFRMFRELTFNMFGLLRTQIMDCMNQLDGIESRYRQKALVFLGIPEVDKEDCSKLVLDTVHTAMGLADLSTASIKSCHRLGTVTKEHHRPIVVWFSQFEEKSTVWKAKTYLKGTKISVREFLTKNRQNIFSKARQHFGMRSCWTLDGVVYVKASDGVRHKLVALDKLTALIKSFPKKASSPEKNN